MTRSTFPGELPQLAMPFAASNRIGPHMPVLTLAGSEAVPSVLLRYVAFCALVQFGLLAVSTTCEA